MMLAPLGVLALFFADAIGEGLPATQALRALVVVALTQILPGFLLWRLIRPVNGSIVEDVVFGFAVGTGLAVIALTFATAFGMPWLVWAVGPSAAGAVLIIPHARHRVFLVRSAPLPASWYLAVSAISVLLFRPAKVFYRLTPFDWGDGFAATYVDMPYHLSIAAQLANRGPTELANVLGEPLQYHWFSHAWVAQVSEAAGVPLDAILFRFMPPLISVFVVFAVASAAMRFAASIWVGPLAALIAVSAGDLRILNEVDEARLVSFLSPSLGMSALALIVLLVLLITRWRSEAQSGSSWLVVGMAVAAAGFKGSSLALVVAGVGLTALVGWLFQWPARRMITVDLLLIGASLAVSLWFLFGRSVGGLTIDPLGALAVRGAASTIVEAANGPTALVWVLGATFLMLSVLARGAGFLGAFNETLRGDPAMPLLGGVGMAGASAVVLLTHPGNSQWYFLWGALPAIAIGSAVGVIALWGSLEDRRIPLRIALATGLVILSVGSVILPLAEFGDGNLLTDSVVVLTILLLILLGAVYLTQALVEARSARAAAAFVVAGALVGASILPTAVFQLVEPLPVPRTQLAPGSAYSFSTDQIQAARWLRDHSDARDIVATNRHCTAVRPEVCDARRFFVSAYTERRILVEGWAYTPTWFESPEVPGRAYFKPFWDPELLELNDSFLVSPSPEGALALQELGVRWLYIDKTMLYSPGLESQAVSRFETDWAWVLELRPQT